MPTEKEIKRDKKFKSKWDQYCESFIAGEEYSRSVEKHEIVTVVLNEAHHVYFEDITLVTCNMPKEQFLNSFEEVE